MRPTTLIILLGALLLPVSASCAAVMPFVKEAIVGLAPSAFDAIKRRLAQPDAPPAFCEAFSEDYQPDDVVLVGCAGKEFETLAAIELRREAKRRGMEINEDLALCEQFKLAEPVLLWTCGAPELEVEEPDEPEPEELDEPG